MCSRFVGRWTALGFAAQIVSAAYFVAAWQAGCGSRVDGAEVAGAKAAGVTAATKPAAGPTDPKKVAATAAHPTQAGIEFFEKKIRPVLSQQCYKCHSATSVSLKAGLRLDTRADLLKGGESGAAIVPGDSQSSLLMEALRFEGLEMPPTGKLSDDQIADFAAWIDMGAPDPRTGSDAKKKLNLAEARQFWAYQPPKKSPAPVVQNAAWPTTDLDRYILATLEKQGLTPAADADKVTWLRRVTFDLIGLPPTIAELDAFVADNSAEAHARVVDRLLASPQFGERWGRHWLDVARYGESTGKERNIPYTHAWRYRDWVVDALNSDKPYTKFITEQIAGDLLPARSPAERNADVIATGFLALGPKSLNERNAEQYLMDIVDEQIDVVTRAFLGTTVGCARCHDHKFDPIPQTDYYALAGIFRSTETLSGVQGRSTKGVKNDYSGELMPLVDAAHPAKPASTGAAAHDPLARLSSAERDEYAKIQERLTERRAELQRLVKSAKSAPSDKKNAAKNAAKKRSKNLSEQIAKDERRLQALQAGGASGSTAATAATEAAAMGVRDLAKPADTELRVRGEPGEKGPVVPRGFVQVLKTSLSPKVNPQQSGRLELARWIASRDNALTARVAVNRIWYHLLGRGLVETVDNFGALGEEPSHPQLLDHLALKFMDEGWSTKKMIRDIVLSRTYRMSSEHDPADYAKDPGNRYFWRMNRRRLDAEQIRDAMLAVGGTLDLTRPAASPVAKLPTAGEIGRRPSTENLDAAVARHRSLYLPIVRNAVPEALAVFDVADPSLVVGQRDVTTVATQSLFLMNGSLANEQARNAVALLDRTSSAGDAQQRVDQAYRTILQRSATADERRRGAAFVQEFIQAEQQEKTAAASAAPAAWAALCQTLMASAEFRYLY